MNSNIPAQGDEEDASFTESFQVMHDDLVSLGAGEQAISGTVIDEESGAAFRVGYRVLTLPPSIIQVVISPSHDAYTVTRVRVDAVNDTPMVEVSRQQADLTSDPALLADAHAMDAGMVVLEGRGLEPTFNQVCFNVEDFELDV